MLYILFPGRFGVLEKFQGLLKYSGSWLMEGFQGLAKFLESSGKVLELLKAPRKVLSSWKVSSVVIWGVHNTWLLYGTPKASR